MNVLNVVSSSSGQTVDMDSKDTSGKSANRGQDMMSEGIGLVS